jgi:hypothetical protein
VAGVLRLSTTLLVRLHLRERNCGERDKAMLDASGNGVAIVPERDLARPPLGRLLDVTAPTIAPALPSVPPISPAPAPSEASMRIESLELELAGARQETLLARRDADLARQEMLTANTSSGELASARVRIAALEGETALTRSALDESSRKLSALEAERDAQLAELRLAHAQLASATEDLRAAYERLHELEIAQGIEQQRQQQPRTASRYAWHS